MGFIPDFTVDCCREGEELEEHLAFALTDGRVGILAVSGRKVRPARPLWRSQSRAKLCWGALIRAACCKRSCWVCLDKYSS